MSVKVAINGFGRIGRLVFRHAYDNPNVDIVAVNDITDPKTLAHLLRRDSVHGPFPVDVQEHEGNLRAGSETVELLSERDPAKLPWKSMGVDVVIESTGLFTKRDKASLHLQAGARKVLISAPATDEDLTIVKGVNDHLYDPDSHHIVSCASCTTNCLAPVVKVLNDAFGLEYGLMTTVHAYTNDQQILDLPHKDLRRARAAALNVIPTTTGAARAVGKVLPEIEGRLNGMAMRVPVSDGSVVDLVATLGQKVTVEEVNAAMKQAASTSPLKGILEYSEEPLVSSDIIGNAHSSVFDALSTCVIGDRLVKVISWYDNEFAYSKRMTDLVEFMV